MTKKSLLLAGVLFLFSFTLAFAKSYDVALSRPTMAGKVQLAAGQYKMRVEGSIVIFTDSHSKSFTAPVKVENGEKKYNATAVETTKDGDSDRITGIQLGGSNSKISFIN